MQSRWLSIKIYNTLPSTEAFLPTIMFVQAEAAAHSHKVVTVI
jgi:hypothetical protein